jgi:hypothetical protein
MWLRDVANVRVHQGTGRVPVEVLAEELRALQPLPQPWCGALSVVPAAMASASVIQHSLSVYDALLAVAEGA